jgi:hypothetical protein
MAEGTRVGDPFATCTEAEAARSGMPHGAFEWEGSAALPDGHPVGLHLCWQPDFDGPLEPVQAAARAAWGRLQAAEAEHRRALVADLRSRSIWCRVRPEDIPPESVWFQPDGSAEVAYGAFVDGEHCVWMQVSPAGEYAGWRAE